MEHTAFYTTQPLRNLQPDRAGKIGYTGNAQCFYIKYGYILYTNFGLMAIIIMPLDLGEWNFVW
jgi:hypothetical protein